MKVLLSSDWHVDSSTGGVDRWPDLERYVDGYLLPAARGADLFVFLGDAFDPGHMLDVPRAAWLLRKARALTEATKHGSVWVAGNHDVIHDTRGFTTLDVLLELSTSDVRCRVFTRPSVTDFPVDDRGTDRIVRFLVLPYVAPVAMKARLVDIIRTAGKPDVCLSHMTVPGAKLGTESREFARGRDQDLPLDRLRELGIELVLQGHYHVPQTIELEGIRVEVVGSPFATRFGEPSEGRGYMFVEV